MALRVHLDTTTFTAFLRKDETAVYVVERASALLLSPIVLGELKAGFALGSRDREDRRILETFLESPRVSIVDIDDKVTDRYAAIDRQLRLQGTPIPTNDLWIAACVGESEALFSYDERFSKVYGLRWIREKAHVKPDSPPPPSDRAP